MTDDAPADDPGLAAGYTRLWREHLARHWRRLVLALVLMAVAAVTSAGYAKFVQLLFEAFETADMGFLIWSPVLILFLAGLKGAAQFAQIVVTNRVLVQLEADLQNRLYHHMMFADLAHLQKESAASLAARLWADSAVVHRSVAAILQGLSNALIVLATFALMLSIDAMLTLAIFAVFALAIWPLLEIGVRVKRNTHKVQGEIGAMTAEVNEGLSSMRLVRTYGLERRLLALASDVIDRLRQFRVQVMDWQARVEPLMELLGGVSSAALLALVVWQLRAGHGSLPEFMALLTGLGVITTPARRLGGTYTAAQQGLASIARIYEILDQQNAVVERDGAVAPKDGPGGIRFANVGFSYPDGTPALSRIDLTIEPGQKVAFVGRSGAGKSSLFNLLPRLFDPTVGQVSLDGTDIRDLTLAGLRQRIAIVSQDAVLLSGTVAENIGFGAPEASRAAIEGAARDAEAHDFISALPDGYDTVIRQGAGAFSGGERQRLSIARALLRDAPILLLDEPTSALDARSEAAIRAALDRLSHGRTTLVIAHRLSTILDADTIVVMEDGRIVDTGSHGDLLTRGGIYAELYRMQFADVLADQDRS